MSPSVGDSLAEDFMGGERNLGGMSQNLETGRRGGIWVQGHLDYLGLWPIEEGMAGALKLPPGHHLSDPLPGPTPPTQLLQSPCTPLPVGPPFHQHPLPGPCLLQLAQQHRNPPLEGRLLCLQPGAFLHQRLDLLRLLPSSTLPSDSGALGCKSPTPCDTCCARFLSSTGIRTFNMQEAGTPIYRILRPPRVDAPSPIMRGRATKPVVVFSLVCKPHYSLTPPLHCRKIVIQVSEQKANPTSIMTSA